MIPPVATGTILLDNNLLLVHLLESTASAERSSWTRGIWVDGGGVGLTVSNNTLRYVRTGMNLENPVNHVVTNNTIDVAGTGISFGFNSSMSSFTGNVLNDVDTDINGRNVAGGYTLNLTGNSSTAPAETLVLVAQ